MQGQPLQGDDAGRIVDAAIAELETAVTLFLGEVCDTVAQLVRLYGKR